MRQVIAELDRKREQISFEVYKYTKPLTKTTTAQNEDALSRHRVRGLFFLAVVLVATIHVQRIDLCNINYNSEVISFFRIVEKGDDRCLQSFSVAFCICVLL